MSDRLKIGGLFYGYGGLDMAVQSMIPADLAWYAEFDKKASRIGAHHHPDIPNHGDVTQIDWASVEPIEILTGGSPCQDLSPAGKRSGMKDGTRSGLWSSMCEAIDIIRPRLVVWENVRGALSAKSHLSGTVVRQGPRGGRKVEVTHRALGRVLSDLAELGYDARWYGLRAADVGAPHGRFRVFLFATPADADLAGLEGRVAGGGSAGERPAGQGGVAPGLNFLPTPRTSDANGAGAHGQGGVDLRTAVELLPTPMVGSTSPAAHGQISGDYRARMDEALTRWGDYAPAIARWETVLGRTAPDPTEPGAKGNPRLSARFVEWLMGLPEGHVTAPEIGLTRNQALKALGNGVVPAQAAAATRAFLHDQGLRP